MSAKNKVSVPRWWKIWAKAGAIGLVTSTQAAPSRGLVMLVWHENQTVPASCYGDYHFGKGNYSVHVCENPNVELAILGKDRAMIYHFA